MFWFLFQTISAKLSDVKKTAAAKSSSTKVNAKITKNEIVVLDSDENWSDDESFAQLIDDKVC